MQPLTRHAGSRCQQRAIPPIAIDLVIQFGRHEPVGGGVSKVFLDRAGKRRLEAYVGQHGRQLASQLDIYVVLSADNRVITAAHRIERIKRS